MIKDKEIYNYFASGGIRKMQGGLCLITAKTSDMSNEDILEKVKWLTVENKQKVLILIKNLYNVDSLSENLSLIDISYLTAKGTNLKS